MKNENKSIQDSGCITPQKAYEMGMSKFQFYQYVRTNDLEPISRGIYVPKNEWIDELYVLHRRCPKAVFSHDEALYYHGLTDREPLIHTFTIYSGYNPHRLTADGSCKAYTVKKELLDVGKMMVVNNCGNQIPMYDLERTICDVIRSRNSMEQQEISTALKLYVSRQDKDLNKLMRYAKLFRIDTIVRQYMEILL